MTAQVVLVPLAAALAASCGPRESGAGGGVERLPDPGSSRVPGGPDGAEVVFRPPGAPAARVAVEVARSGRQIQTGLMHRAQLPAGAGMLFLFARQRVQRFWMKDTLIPLDMIFVSSDMVVVGVVENAAPRTLTRRSVPGRPSQYVVEVNAGWARAHGISAGVPVEFIGVAPLRPGEGEIEYYDDGDEDEGNDEDE
jgi:uncharacterized membrane protein (UPF0127 family)